MIYKLKVVTRLQDNGDGGYSVYGYNDENELIKHHPAANIDGQMTSEKRAEILSEHDPYRNGYINRGIIEIDIRNSVIDVAVEDSQNGIVRLSKPFHFHAGQ